MTEGKVTLESIFPPITRSKSKLKRQIKNMREKKWWRGERLKSKFKEFDLYGEQIGLTYKGQRTFKTTPGAIVSLSVISVLFAFTVYRLITFLNKEDPSVSKQSFMRNLDGERPLSPNYYGFEIAFGLGGNVELDPSIGYFSVN
jgi:hypothetical protein